MRVSLDCSHCSRNGCAVASAIALKSNCAKSPVALRAILELRRDQTLGDQRFGDAQTVSISSVGGWKVDARDSSLKPAFASSTVTGTP
jgi:hypothetical protein